MLQCEMWTVERSEAVKPLFFSYTSQGKNKERKVGVFILRYLTRYMAKI